MAGAADKSSLSKNLMQMKFMRRSVIRLEKEQNAEEHRRVIDEEHWVLDLPELKEKRNPYQSEPSIAPCEDLLFARMSFKGFNPDIEKLMTVQNFDQSLVVSEQKEKEIGVDEDEMTQRYQNLIGTIANKFVKKRQKTHQNEETDVTIAKKSKREFMKPGD